MIEMTVHPRVIELMRERIGKDVCDKTSDDELVACTEGTFLRLDCTVQHFGECLQQSIADTCSALKKSLRAR